MMLNGRESKEKKSLQSNPNYYRLFIMKAEREELTEWERRVFTETIQRVEDKKASLDFGRDRPDQRGCFSRIVGCRAWIC